jgi:peptide/nickel transport system substrate-binding protein
LAAGGSVGLLGPGFVGGFVQRAFAQDAGNSKSGGTLIWIHDRDLDHYDLHQITSTTTARPLVCAYSQLVQYDQLDQNKIIPDLAETWEISSDGLTYTFHLRQGVRFHDGQPLTSADAKTSLERLYNPPDGVLSPQKDWLAAIDSVETPDPSTVVLHLKFPAGYLINILGMGFASIYPKHILDAKGDMKADIVGTGPFKLAAHDRGVSVKFVKNDDYYRKDRPYLDGIEFRVIRDASTRYNVFKTANAHITSVGGSGLNVQQADEMRSTMADKVTVWNTADLSGEIVSMNMSRKPWDDVRVRRAIHLGIDRQAYAKAVYGGAFTVSGHFYQQPWGLPHDELLKMPGFRQPKDEDRAEAKKLISDAGIPSDFEARILTQNSSDDQSKSTFLQDQLSRIGIKSRLDIQDPTPYADSLFVKHDYDLVIAAYGAQIVDPAVGLNQRWHTGAARNLSLSNFTDIDALIDQQNRETDQEKRAAIVREIEGLLLDHVPDAPMGFNDTLTGMWNTVKNWRMHDGRWTFLKHESTWLGA